MPQSFKCEGGEQMAECSQEMAHWVAPAALVIAILVCCLVGICCHRFDLGHIVLCCSRYGKRTPTSPFESSPMSGQALVRGVELVYHVGARRPVAEPPTELRQGQTDLLELRQQWHAQRAAREAARASGVEEALGPGRPSAEPVPRLSGAEQVSEAEQRAAALEEHEEHIRLAQKALEYMPLEEAAGPRLHDACCICLSDYSEGEQLRVLLCGHRFHCRCIKDWVAQAPTCPICKEQIEAQSVSVRVEPSLESSGEVVGSVPDAAVNGTLPGVVSHSTVDDARGP